MTKKVATIADLAKLKSFNERYQFDVHQIKGLVEQKQKFNYISWAFAEQIGHVIWEDFEWHPVINQLDGTIVHGDCVIISMTGEGKTRTYSYPIIDHGNSGCRKDENGHLRFWQVGKKNWTTKEMDPGYFKEYVTSFDINNAQMRGMSKLFSMMSGIGLSMFTGEDLRIYDKETPPQPQQQEQPVKQASAPKFNKAKAINTINALPQARLEKLLTHYKVASVDEMKLEQVKSAYTLLTK